MSENNPITDNYLLETLKSGDKKALGDFYCQGRAAFIQWAQKHFLFQQDDIIDIYQDATAILYENIVLGKYVKGDSSIKTYLYAIAKNLFYQRIQRREREEKKLKLSGYDWYTHESLSKEDEEKINITQDVFANMGDPCKSILQLFYYDKLSMSEIASRLGYKSDKVVKSQKVRCLKTLREEVIKKMDKQNV